MCRLVSMYLEVKCFLYYIEYCVSEKMFHRPHFTEVPFLEILLAYISEKENVISKELNKTWLPVR